MMKLRLSRWVAVGIAMLASAASAIAPQTEADAYTRYELLAPASHRFRIVYEITATTPGATAYYNPIRPGSTASDERVTDRATGKPLRFAEGDAAAAQAGGVADAKPGNRYIAVTLAHPVPTDGGARILIEKTYADAKSYHGSGDNVIFDRSLGVARNAVVLPAGYELAACNVPSQVLQQADGRIMISFWNSSPAPAPLILKLRLAKLPAASSSVAAKLSERASQTRNIVYYLHAPESHSFSLTHDYTEMRPGIASYVNVVRTGSQVSNPGARDLDTGERLPAEMIRGAAVRQAEPEATDVTAETQAVVFRFAPIISGTSRRLRISETYTDPARYLLSGDELVWHRSFGRAANAVVLPAGWALTNSSVPATVSLTPAGEVRLDFVNPRLDEIDVIVTARRRL